MTLTTRRITPADGATLKRIRLAALLDTPSAFAMTHAQESTNSDDRWAELASARAEGHDHSTFFAVIDGQEVGLVGGHRVDGGSDVELVSMWTDPAGRGRGVGAALVAAVVDWADGSPVNLWVTQGNDAAQRLYERCGFAVTGDVAPLPSDPCKDEVRMRREPESR